MTTCDVCSKGNRALVTESRFLLCAKCRKHTLAVPEHLRAEVLEDLAGVSDGLASDFQAACRNAEQVEREQYDADLVDMSDLA